MLLFDNSTAVTQFCEKSCKFFNQIIPLYNSFLLNVIKDALEVSFIIMCILSETTVSVIYLHWLPLGMFA